MTFLSAELDKIMDRAERVLTALNGQTLSILNALPEGDRAAYLTRTAELQTEMLQNVTHTICDSAVEIVCTLSQSECTRDHHFNGLD